MPGNVAEIYELSIAGLPTEPSDRTILSLLIRSCSLPPKILMPDVNWLFLLGFSPTCEL